jgi:predicted Fe-Mo cluster-binding NifX family protein
MKIAVATEGDFVAEHFGRCSTYTIADVVDGEPQEKTVVASPKHEPGRLPRFLADLDVSVVIAGGMGPKAQALFQEEGIQVLIGVTGTVDNAMTEYVSGNLRSGQSLCEHPHEDHHGGCGKHDGNKCC